MGTETMREIELDITTLAHGGRGMGRHDGKAIFVPLTMPGDRVHCRIVKAKARFAEAELVEIITPSPQRQAAPCPYFEKCGGCQWQHMPYPLQSEWKAKIFADLLTRSGVAEEDTLLSIVPSPSEWSYRNRVQFKCEQSGDARKSDDRFVMGFYRPESHDIVDIEKCMLADEKIQQLYTLLRQELPKSPRADAISQVDVSCGDDDKTRVIVHVAPKAVAKMEPWLQKLAEKNGFDACLQSGAKNTLQKVSGVGQTLVRPEADEPKLYSNPGGFVQVNPPQNRNMVAAMIERLQLTGKEKVLDLFCGMGNFSLPLAKRCAQVVGVENYAPAIMDARRNARRNADRDQQANAEFHVADAASYLRNTRPGDFDLVVLDPPRSGSAPVTKALLEVRPERVLYISCDPATLTRDLKQLVQNGYQVVSAQAFDLFPQTWHIESMTLLQRCD
ncbi:MAG: 23S rRNA (uracil(1939)-C(5))-methyltransferase RlmD [Desulfuromonadales bacterium]|nr:23S rRNA (uracil(1939)-C(5))-methyltransferase RlmD [Desulfuromonadales bacterium]